VKRKGADADWNLVQAINNSPGASVYELAKLMNWSTGKTYGCVKFLEKQGLVRSVKSESKGCAVRRFSPTRWQDFFTPEKLEEFRDTEL
jgi:hypothetical protein